MWRMPSITSVIPSANLVLSIALNTLKVMHRIFEETCSLALGRTRIRSPSGSMTSLLIGSAFCVVAILESPCRVIQRFLLRSLQAYESVIRFKDEMFV